MTVSKTAGAALVALMSTSAFAHILMTQPTNMWGMSAAGDPQKLEPCGEVGPGDSGVVTTLVAGQPYDVKWTETVGHPGHFRISIGNSTSVFMTPDASISANNCDSAPIQSPPVAPTLLDGLYPHSAGVTGTQYTQTITVPNTPCNPCYLQLLQFMSAHAPPCFYFHCAAIRIVMADAGVDAGVDGGVKDAGVDAGVKDAGTPDAGAKDSGVTDSGTGGGGGGSGGGAGGGTGGGAGGGTGGGSSSGGGTGGAGGGASGGGTGTGGGTASGGSAGGSMNADAGRGGGDASGLDAPGCTCGAVAGLPLWGFALALAARRRSRRDDT